MSVIHFESDELANLVVAATRNLKSMDQRKAIVTMAKAMEQYSIENVRAYNATYGARHGIAMPMQYQDIAIFAIEMEFDFSRACGTFNLLRYNLIANSGENFATEGTIKALIIIGEALDAMSAEMQNVA